MVCERSGGDCRIWYGELVLPAQGGRRFSDTVIKRGGNKISKKVFDVADIRIGESGKGKHFGNGNGRYENRPSEFFLLKHEAHDRSFSVKVGDQDVRIEYRADIVFTRA